jgi:hypothetical protein
MKPVYAGLALVFGIFAAVQFNDPDSFLWIVIYGVIALVSVLRIFGIFQKGMVFFLLIAIGLFTLLHAPYAWEWLTSSDQTELIGKMITEKPFLEGTREFFGLVLADLALAFHLYYPGQKR